MMNAVFLFALLYGIVSAETAVNGIRASNVLGGSEQHASFSFIRPGLTQTSYAFNGPSSHQSFSSSIGNPHLAQKVLPNVANALAYRNPGLGYFPTAPVSTGYANLPYVHPTGVHPVDSSSHLTPSATGFAYNQQLRPPIDEATALAYLQQYYQQQSRIAQPVVQRQMYSIPENTGYQPAQLGQIFALRQQQALLQLQAQAQHQQAQGHQTTNSQHIPVHEASQEVPEQVRLEQQVQQQPERNLLGVAYSSAPSVAHVKVTGNGYKFNF